VDGAETVVEDELSRQQPVIEITQRFDQKDERLRQFADLVQKTSGKLTPILDVTLQHSNAGLVVAAGATVTVEGTHSSLDFLDANIDSARLIVRGKTAAAGPITLQLYDVTNGVVLATVTVAVALATSVGAWTSVASVAGERVVALRVVGDGANAQTIYSCHGQFYSQRFIS
jgi:hypothetical protein